MKTNQELLEDLGINLKGIRTSGKTKCPKCGDQSKHRNKTDLSVKVPEGQYKCHNPGCDFKGVVKNEYVYVPKPKDYTRPKFNNRTEVSDKIVNWFFEKRSISQGTLIKNKITDGLAWMPQVFRFEYQKLLDEGVEDAEARLKANQLAKVNTIQFNYFRNGELINVKYRDGSKNFRLEKDAELIFYGYDDVKDSDWCIIVEGEIDKLAFSEAGIQEVISVPNGAVISENPEDLKLEYLDNCMELFANKTKIILATDDDEAGRFLREELSRRLGKDRCFKINFEGSKDGNEYLHAHGPEKLKNLIEDDKLVEYPLSGIITADMVWSEMEDIIENGLPQGEKIGIRSLDDVVTWILGYFWMITGIPNHGKSPFVLQICCLLAVKFGWKFGVFSPEHRKVGIYMIKIMEMITGKRAPFKGLTDEEKRVAKIFINDHFFVIKPEDKDHALDNVLSHGRMLVRAKGIRGIIADPWNKFEHNRPAHLNETEYISKELDKITDFCEETNCILFQVAHPTKMKKKDDIHEVPTLYDISSSSNFYNKCDGGITIYRNHKTKYTEIFIQKVKDDHIGRLAKIELQWNPANGRLGEIARPDNSNWLAPKQEQATMELIINEPEPEVPFTTDPGEDAPF
jgi:twinkle protein